MPTIGKCIYDGHCKNRTDLGYCGLTGNCPEEHLQCVYEVGTSCIICGTFIEGGSYPSICPECKKRINRIIYPEK